MPAAIQNIMAATPTTYFVRLAQGILYRGVRFFTVALIRFRKAVTQAQV